MQARQYLSTFIVLLAAALAACSGGSGSSGFDAFPSTENAAITQALAEQRCVKHGTLTICPADETGAPPTIPGTPSPAPPGGGRVDTGLDPRVPVPCAQPAAAAACTFTVPFAPEGFPSTAVFRIAVRTVHPIGAWTFGPELPPGESIDAPATLAPTALTGGASAVQVAVLVFLQPSGVVLPEESELAKSGADFAFVTDELSIRVALSAE